MLRDILRGRLAPDPDPHGLRLRGACIAGRLDLENLTTNVALELHDCLLREGLVARDATLPYLVLVGCWLEHPAEPPLTADRLTAAGLRLDQAVITADCEPGAVGLTGAHLKMLECNGATIRNDTGPALDGQGLRVDQDVFLSGGFEAVGARDGGAVRLRGAHLGQLVCTGATIRNDSGPALHAEHLWVDQSVALSGVKAVGAGDDGTVRLAGAHLGGQLTCTGATIRNDSGPALRAEGLQVDQNVLLSGGFEAVGTGDDGAVVLAAARIRGLLDCSGATVRNDAGPALNAYEMQVDQGALLVDKFTAISGGTGEHETLNLANVRIGGVLGFAPAKLEHTADPHARLFLDGLTYPGLPRRIPPRDWLRLLREATPRYAAQPYQQLAAAHRAAGHDGEARRVLMAQRRDQIDRRALTGRAERAWAKLTGLTLGYGYQPWRALIALVAIAAIAVVLAVTLGAHGGVARTDSQSRATTQCSAAEQVGVGLDLGLPLIKTGTRDHCDTTSSATGQVLTVAGWVLQLLAWAFGTLFVAGFTGAVRKT